MATHAEKVGTAARVVQTRWTVRQVRALKPCYAETYIRVLFAGRQSVTLADVLAMPIPDIDKVWFVTRPRVLAPALRARWIERIVTRAIKQHALMCGIPLVAQWAAAWIDGTDRPGEVLKAAVAALDAGAVGGGAASAAAWAAWAAWAASAASAADAVSAWAAAAARAAAWAAESARAASEALEASSGAAAWAASGAAESAAAAERTQQIRDLRALLNAAESPSHSERDEARGS